MKNSNNELALKYNLHSRYISLIRGKKRWKHLWENMFKNMFMKKAQIYEDSHEFFFNKYNSFINENNLDINSNIIV